jgi:hypothetical protein
VNTSTPRVITLALKALEIMIAVIIRRSLQASLMRRRVVIG